MEANPSQPQVRYRINTATTTKGVITWDATVEVVFPVGEGADLLPLRTNALKESDELVAALKARYPVEKP